MHRNTAIIIAVLATVAAFVVGLKLGLTLSTQELPTMQSSPSPIALLPSPSPRPLLKTFIHKNCGVQITYPSDYQINEASTAAILTNSSTKDQVNLLCGENFPIPSLPPERTEQASIAGQLATVYHDTSTETNQPLDIYVFNHPFKSVQVALFGFGEIFETIIQSLQFTY